MQIGDFIESMDPAAQAANEALHNAGGEVYVVGGAVRDLVLGKTPNDYDLLVTGISTPEVKKALKSIPEAKVGLVGAAFGVFLLLPPLGGELFEVIAPDCSR